MLNDVSEIVRTEAIEAHDLRDAISDPAFNELVTFAATLCAAPIALISVVEESRQVFLARCGLQADQTGRDVSFCAHAMHHSGIMTVPDATGDPRFADNLLVTGEPFIRFYAGAPLITDDGIPLGSLCVIDRVPRPGLTSLQTEGLTVLARYVMTALRARRDAKQERQFTSRAERTIFESEQKFRLLADTMPQMVWSTLPDGYHDYYNARWYEFTGVPEGSTDGEAWNGMFHPEDQDRAWATWRQCLATGNPYEIEYRLRNAGGEYRWTLGRALPMRNAGGEIVRWFGTCTDIHDQKLLAQQREIVSQELSHRIKNIFSVIGGLIGMSARTYPDMKPLAGDLRERIMALGRAHDFVRPHSPMSRPTAGVTGLQGLLGKLLTPYRSATDDRIVITGIEIAIDDRAATPLALLFHELATNSAKYGALSSAEGKVVIDVATDGTSAILTWTETGGPTIAQPPTQRGFGSRLIELSVNSQLGGRLDCDWAMQGLRATVHVPNTAMSRAS